MGHPLEWPIIIFWEDFCPWSIEPVEISRLVLSLISHGFEVQIQIAGEGISYPEKPYRVILLFEVFYFKWKLL